MNTFLRAAVGTTLALFFVVAIVGPTGCAAIVGADDYQVGAAGGQVGQAGAQVGVGGSDGTGGRGTGGTHLGSGGIRDLDASGVVDVLTKKETSIDPVEDASRPETGPIDTGKPMPAGSGESLCTTTCTGPGLSCIHTTWGPSGLCLYGCPTSNSECDSNHSCIHAKDPAVGLDYSCLKTCPTGVCPTGMVCLPLSTVSICEPMDWFPKNLGLGDDCLFDQQCKSGQCYNKPNGFCSRPCTELDGTCDGDYADGANYYGEYNWCVNTGGAFRCVPGCGLFTVDCDNYPGTTCRVGSDIYGLSPDVCLK
jgi:hypothetical protein